MVTQIMSVDTCSFFMLPIVNYPALACGASCFDQAARDVFADLVIYGIHAVHLNCDDMIGSKIVRYVREHQYAISYSKNKRSNDMSHGRPHSTVLIELQNKIGGSIFSL